MPKSFTEGKLFACKHNHRTTGELVTTFTFLTRNYFKSALHIFLLAAACYSVFSNLPLLLILFCLIQAPTAAAVFREIKHANLRTRKYFATSNRK